MMMVVFSSSSDGTIAFNGWCMHVIHVHMNVIPFFNQHLVCLKDCSRHQGGYFKCRCGLSFDYGISYFIDNVGRLRSFECHVFHSYLSI